MSWHSAVYRAGAKEIFWGFTKSLISALARDDRAVQGGIRADRRVRPRLKRDCATFDREFRFGRKGSTRGSECAPFVKKTLFAIVPEGGFARRLKLIPLSILYLCPLPMSSILHLDNDSFVSPALLCRAKRSDVCVRLSCLGGTMSRTSHVSPDCLLRRSCLRAEPPCSLPPQLLQGAKKLAMHRRLLDGQNRSSRELKQRAGGSGLSSCRPLAPIIRLPKRSKHSRALQGTAAAIQVAYAFCKSKIGSEEWHRSHPKSASARPCEGFLGILQAAESPCSCYIRIPSICEQAPENALSICKCL
jgi:hypothetical protein